ncbi:MAG: adenylate/guanylate cyclase domain-containing protein [Moraxellaceae bacterium]|nr:adenylate/guanylate cyclase domain-containing protein [Moraxellaceae bacterium]
MPDAQQKHHTAVMPQHTRMLAYIIAGCIFAAGVFKGYYGNHVIAIIPLTVLIPWSMGWLADWLENNHPDQVQSGLFLTDATAVGFGIAAAGYSMVPSLTFVSLLMASAMAFGNLYLLTLAGFCTLVASLLGGLVFGLEVLPYAGTPAELTFVAIAGFAAYVGLSAFYIREQSNAMLRVKNEMLEQQEQAIQLSRKLVKYLPTQVWESIFSGRRDARLQNHRKKLSIFFSDIKDFTETTDEMSPDALTEMLNYYFDQMSKIALRYGGTIDKFIGDAILIFYGDPTTKGAKEDALACVSMAIDMRKQLQVMRQKWQSMGIEKPLHVRMGITTGYCHVGNFGCESRMDYTIIGRDANLASRLQSVAEPDEILISNDTYLLVRDRIMCREKGTVRLRGIANPVQVWEVVDFRADMGAVTTWIEHELDGFAMLMDINKVKNYDKDRIVKALEGAAQKLKDKRIV